MRTTDQSTLDVEIEDEATWPDELRRMIADEWSLFLAYQRERQRIERLQRHDIRLRIRPPDNEYEDDHDALLETLERLLQPHRLVASHCTRLTPREEDAVRTGGLRVLTPVLVPIHRRISICI